MLSPYKTSRILRPLKDAFGKSTQARASLKSDEPALVSANVLGWGLPVQFKRSQMGLIQKK